MIGRVLELDDLKKITGYHRPTEVATCLTSQNVTVLWGKGGPFTTVDALNKALGVLSDAKPGTYGKDDV